MGFNKKFITINSLLENIQNLEGYFGSADAFVFDDFSFKFYTELDSNEREIRKTIKSELKTGCPDSHPKYSELHSLSENLISLYKDPSWLEIHFTKDKLNCSLEICGDFEEQKKLSINKIIDYFSKR